MHKDWTSDELIGHLYIVLSPTITGRESRGLLMGVHFSHLK